MYKHLSLLSRFPMFSVCFVLFLRDSVYRLRLSMYMSPLVMLSCIYLLVVFVVCMFTVLVALFVCMIVLDTLYLCLYLCLHATQ